MKHQLHHRSRGKPLLSLRPLSVSLFLSLVVVFHSVSSLAKSFDEESVFGQKRPSVYKEGSKQEFGIRNEGDDKPIDELRLSLIENPLKKTSAENPHILDSQNPVATARGPDCPTLKILTAPSGFIRFPMAGEYGINLNCRWKIVAPPGKVIQLQVLSIDIEISNNCHNCCAFDRLQLYSVTRKKPYLMAELCGEVIPPAPYTTNTSEARVVFGSDGSIGDNGFLLSYGIIPRHNASSESKCGISDFEPKVDSRIVGGVEATPHSWPWQVSIVKRNQSIGLWEYQCGGSVLSPHWIITAAHCVFKGGEADYKIVLGEHNRTKYEGTEQEFKVKKLFIHEKYDYDTAFNDIALIRLSKDVKFDSYIKPICLPDDYDDDVKDGTICVSTGWGLTNSKQDDNVLNQVYLPVINNSQCNQPDWNGGRVTDNMICAGYPEGVKSSCRGDSGGPLVSFSEGKWKLFGVTIGFGECALPRHPSVYTRVAKYLKWIRNKTEPLSKGSTTSMRTTSRQTTELRTVSSTPSTTKEKE